MASNVGIPCPPSLSTRASSSTRSGRREALRFHQLIGSNAQLNDEKTVASTRSDDIYCQGYCFSNRAIGLGEKVVLKVLKVSHRFSGSFSFGLTACPPELLAHHQPHGDLVHLPDDDNDLADRPEYWALVNDVHDVARTGDVLTFHLLFNGDVVLIVNNQERKLMSVDCTLNLWVVLNLRGRTRALELVDPNVHRFLVPLPVLEAEGQVVPLQVQEEGEPIELKPNVNLDDSIVIIKEIKAKQPRGSSRLNSTLDAPQFVGNCVICYAKPSDTVIYPCGHKAICVSCSVVFLKQAEFRQKKLPCPVCRKLVKDVIKIYAS